MCEVLLYQLLWELLITYSRVIVGYCGLIYELWDYMCQLIA